MFEAMKCTCGQFRKCQWLQRKRLDHAKLFECTQFKEMIQVDSDVNDKQS